MERQKPEDFLMNVIKEFKEATGVDIYQTQLVDIFKDERPDLKADFIRQYIQTTVDRMVKKKKIKRTSRWSSNNLKICQKDTQASELKKDKSKTPSK